VSAKKRSIEHFSPARYFGDDKFQSFAQILKKLQSLIRAEGIGRARTLKPVKSQPRPWNAGMMVLQVLTALRHNERSAIPDRMTGETCSLVDGGRLTGTACRNSGTLSVSPITKHLICSMPLHFRIKG
jgi:hypothetical protein